METWKKLSGSRGTRQDYPCRISLSLRNRASPSLGLLQDIRSALGLGVRKSGECVPGNGRGEEPAHGGDSGSRVSDKGVHILECQRCSPLRKERLLEGGEIPDKMVAQVFPCPCL